MDGLSTPALGRFELFTTQVLSFVRPWLEQRRLPLLVGQNDFMARDVMKLTFKWHEYTYHHLGVGRQYNIWPTLRFVSLNRRI